MQTTAQTAMGIAMKKANDAHEQSLRQEAPILIPVRKTQAEILHKLVTDSPGRPSAYYGTRIGMPASHAVTILGRMRDAGLLRSDTETVLKGGKRVHQYLWFGLRPYDKVLYNGAMPHAKPKKTKAAKVVQQQEALREVVQALEEPVMNVPQTSEIDIEKLQLGEARRLYLQLKEIFGD